MPQKLVQILSLHTTLSLAFSNINCHKQSAMKIIYWRQNWTHILNDSTSMKTKMWNFCLKKSARSFQAWKNFGRLTVDYQLCVTKTSKTCGNFSFWTYLYRNGITTIDSDAFKDLMSLEVLQHLMKNFSLRWSTWEKLGSTATKLNSVGGAHKGELRIVKKSQFDFDCTNVVLMK